MEVIKMVDAQKIVLFLASLKIVLNLFNIDVFSDAQAEAIANGIAAIVAVAVAVYSKIQEGRLQTELNQVKSELNIALRRD